MNIYEKLLNIQNELKAPKNQHNNFGNYDYRSCEDILEAVKPLLDKYKLTLTISDEIVQIGNRYYVKATAKLIDVKIEQESVLIQTTGEIKSEVKGSTIYNVAYAREEEQKKGMDRKSSNRCIKFLCKKICLKWLILYR